MEYKYNPLLSNNINKSLEKLNKLIGSSPESETKLNIEKSEILEILQSVEKLTDEQLTEQRNLLNFFKVTTIKQSKTAETQEKTSKRQYNLSIFLTIVTMLISLIPFCREVLFPEPNYNESIIKIIGNQSQQSETTANMYKNLLDLHHQVESLEKQNALLKLKIGN